MDALFDGVEQVIQWFVDWGNVIFIVYIICMCILSIIIGLLNWNTKKEPDDIK